MEATLATAELAKAEWQTYFDQVSKALGPKRAEIEVNSLQLRSQIEAE